MDQLLASGPPLLPQATMVSSAGTSGFHTHASTDLSALPASGEESGPTYQSMFPSNVTALTPSIVSTFGMSNSASKSPSSDPVFSIVSNGPASVPVTSKSTRTSAKATLYKGINNVVTRAII